MQRTQEVTARHKRFRSLRLGPRPFVRERYIGVYRRVELLYALKEKLRQFDGVRRRDGAACCPIRL